MCKNLKTGTVLGKKPKRALFPQSHGSSAKSVCHKLPPELNKSASGSQCGEVSMSAQDAEFVRSGREVGKAPSLAKDPRRPISATICSVLEAGWKPSTPAFWQAPEASASLDGALFNKAQIIDSFSKDMEMQTWKRAAGHSLSSGMERGIVTDFAKKAKSQLIKEGNFMAARALDFLVCGAINEPHLPADGSIPNQFSVFVATREPWPPGSRNCGNVQETVSTITHT